MVQNAIEISERFGINKYSRCVGLNLDRIGELDYYALALFYMVEYNSVDCRDAFFGNKMSVSDMQARLWQALLYANYLRLPKWTRHS